MARSLFRWTVVVAFVQLSYESAGAIHMCHAVSKHMTTHQTQQSGNITIIKFDGMWFPYTVNNPTVNNLSTPAAAGFHSDNTTSENSTTTVVTQTEYITSTSTTTKRTRSTLDNRGGKRESQTEWNPSCRCHIQTADSFMISVITVWKQPNIQHLRLQLNSTTANVTSVQISESWNRTFQNTSVTVSVTVSVAGDVLLTHYTVLLDVTGNVTSVTCVDAPGEPQEAEAGDGRNKLRPLNANAELLFEAPLLIIGAVLAVIGSLLIITGIAVWRRYRRERKRQAKYAKAERENELPGDNYEMITYDHEHQGNKCSNSDNDSSVRKFSMSSASHSEQHRKDSLSSINTHPQATRAANCPPVTKSPGQTKHNSEGVIGARTGKRDNKKYTCADDSDKGDYSEVEQEYENISKEAAHSVKKPDSRVATPLAFLKPGQQQQALKKTDNLNQIKAKTGSLPHATLLNEEDNAYSHLDRLDKLRSYCLRKQPRENLVSNDTADVKNSADVLQVNMNSSNKPKRVSQIIKEIEEMITSDTKTEEEQDHIYEALGEQESIKEREDNIKPTSSRCLTTEPKSANDTSISTAGTDNYPTDNKLVTTEAPQSDLADNMCYDGGNIHNVGKGAQNTEIEMTLRNPTEMHLGEQGIESTMVKDNYAAERPMKEARESAAKFSDNLIEAQADIDDVRTSKTDSGELNNSDTNDKTQILKVKDPAEERVISNYINIIPVKKSMSMDRQVSMSSQDNLNGTQGDVGMSNKDSHDCCDTADNMHATEALEVPPDRLLHSENSVNKDCHVSVSDQVKDNDIQDARRISHKDADANCAGDLNNKSDVSLLSSNLPETVSATELGGQPDANNYSYCIDDDLESYTIVDNIVYGSLPVKSCSKL